VQKNAPKKKQNGFHLLAFIFPNRDFSKGYGQRNKQNPARVSGCVQNVSGLRPTRAQTAFLQAPCNPWLSPVNGKNITRISLFAKKLSTLAAVAVGMARLAVGEKLCRLMKASGRPRT
jgi:hypothetical protein